MIAFHQPLALPVQYTIPKGSLKDSICNSYHYAICLVCSEAAFERISE